jgi:hypothetical protein
LPKRDCADFHFALLFLLYRILNFNNFSTAPPRIRLEPQRQVVRPGDQVDIRCEASGDQPITINWFKMDGVLPPAVLVNNGQLQVLNNKFLNCYLYSLTIFFYPEISAVPWNRRFRCWALRLLGSQFGGPG